VNIPPTPTSAAPRPALRRRRRDHDPAPSTPRSTKRRRRKKLLGPQMLVVTVAIGERTFKTLERLYPPTRWIGGRLTPGKPCIARMSGGKGCSRGKRALPCAHQLTI
jgi:hypothetical protein